jgi:hypothetical protein
MRGAMALCALCQGHALSYLILQWFAAPDPKARDGSLAPKQAPCWRPRHKNCLP